MKVGDMVKLCQPFIPKPVLLLAINRDEKTVHVFHNAKAFKIMLHSVEPRS
jgi:hypothetical protein